MEYMKTKSFILSITLVVITLIWLLSNSISFVQAIEISDIEDGDLIRAIGDVDVWIVKYTHSTGSEQGDKKFKRLILNPEVFNMYGHLFWEDIKDVDPLIVDSFIESTLIKAIGDTRVYKLYPTGDTGEKRLIETMEIFDAWGFDWDAVYTINEFDRDAYIIGEPLGAKFVSTVPSTPGLDSDLIIQSFVSYPSRPINGDTVTLYATVKNQGEGSADSSITYLNIDGESTERILTSALISDKAITITFKEVWKAITGSHTLEICTDADSEISESEEENNCFSSKVNILKTAFLPDYIIKLPSIIPSSPTSGDTISFSAKVYNQGNVIGAGSSYTRLRIDVGNNGNWDGPVNDSIVDSLSAGGNETELFKYAWAAIPGTHKYEICADATSYIAESDETNNCISKIFIVE